MLSLRTERTYVAWRLVDQAVAYHFVLPLEAFATFGTITSLHGTVVRSTLGMNVGMGALFECQSIGT